MKTFLFSHETPRRPWRLGAGTLLGLVLAAGSALGADADGDGLDDAFEDELISRFAPVVKLYPDDEYRPASVEWYLARVRMRYDHAGCEDCQILDLGSVNLTTLLAQAHEEKTAVLCTHNGNYHYSRSGAPDESHRTDFFLQIPNNADEETTRRGSLAAAKCYAHARKAPIIHHPSFIDVQYWFFYPYNGPIDSTDLFAHEGDWEHITVRVDEDGQTIHRIYFAAHDNEGRWYDQGSPGTGYSLSGTHPVVYSARHSHASYPWAGKWARVGLPDDHTAEGPVWDTLNSVLNLGEGDLPKTGREWVQYTGHWGEIGGVGFTTGPYGPAFQGSWSADPIANDDPAGHGWIFVNHSWPLPGSGTYYNPFREFTNGTQAVSVGGTIWIYPGTYSAAGTYTRLMTLRAAAGAVVLGN